MGKKPRRGIVHGPSRQESAWEEEMTNILKSKPILGQRVIDLGFEIVEISLALSTSQCQHIIEVSEKFGFVTALQKQSKRNAFRHNGRIGINSVPVANSLFDLLKPFLPAGAIGLSENMRVYRYEPGQSFGKHVDESSQCLLGETTHTLLIYLGTSELVGGETVFYDKGDFYIHCSVKPIPGKALTHAHGQRCLTHEALAVSKGVKYVLRSDVVCK